MAHSLPLPPPGCDALPVEEQIDYVQSLCDHIAASVDQVPLQHWQQALLEERLAAHRRSADNARPWREAIERAQQHLRADGKCSGSTSGPRPNLMPLRRRCGTTANKRVSGRNFWPNRVTPLYGATPEWLRVWRPGDLIDSVCVRCILTLLDRPV